MYARLAAGRLFAGVNLIGAPWPRGAGRGGYSRRSEAVAMPKAFSTPPVLPAIAALCLAVMVGRAFWVLAWAMMGDAVTPDLGWLLQAGRHILERREIPSHDLFSWTHPERPWVLYQWLFESAVALGERLAGLDALARLTMVLGAAVYVFGPAMGGVPRGVPVFLTILCGSVALFVASIGLSLRPLTLTVLFLGCQYALVSRHRRGELGLAATALVLTPLYALWANLHMGVTLGLLSLLLMAAGDALEGRRIYRFEPADRAVEGAPAGPRAYGLLFALALAASFVNPYGPGIYAYLAELSLESGMNAAIVELQSPDFRDGRMTMFLVMGGVFLVSLSRARRALPAHEMLHLVVFTAMTLAAARFVVVACLFYALFLPKALHHHWTASGDAHAALSGLFRAFERRRGAVLAALGALALGLLVVFPASIQPFRPGACAPVIGGIEAYQRSKRPTDRLFNDPLIGSCSVAAYPETRVFIDTRFDFYGGAFVLETREALVLAGDWRGFLERWRVDVFLVSKAWPLARRLKDDRAGRIVYEDDAVILVRREG